MTNHQASAQNQERQTPRRRGLTPHDILWIVHLSILAAILFWIGKRIVGSTADPRPYLYALTALSLACAFHFFGVSAAICGVYIKEAADRRDRIRRIERRIVQSAHFAFAAGLFMLLTAGLKFLDKPLLLTYATGAVLLMSATIKYFVFERDWPWRVIDELRE